MNVQTMMTVKKSIWALVVAGVAWMPVEMAAADATPAVEKQAPLAVRPVIDVRHDIISMGIGTNNAVADGVTDATAPIQAAIDHLAAREGGTVLVPAGNYRVSSLKVVDNVDLVGDGPDKTVLRAHGRGRTVIALSGGSVVGMTLYGTHEEGSGANWKIGSGGVGKGGTALTAFCIVADAVTNGATIFNVHASEVRYDALYVRQAHNLKVLNCRFDRSARNVVSLVGNTDGFLFADCHFGSLWGLYLFDIEPNDGRYVRNGVIVNCTFDGSKAGQMSTDTWGAFLGFCGDRVGDGLSSRNVTVKNCRFDNIWVRIQGVFPEVKFIDNNFLNASAAFIKVRSNKVGEFRNAVVRDNTFARSRTGALRVVAGATFTGNTIVEGNQPPEANDIPVTAESQDLAWEEIHPVTQRAETGAAAQTKFGENQIVTMRLQGHKFRFSDGQVLPHSRSDEDGDADLIMHIDPLIAVGEAGLQRIGKGAGDTFKTVPSTGYERRLFGVATGDVCAVRTRQGRHVVMEVLAFSSKEIQFRYRFVEVGP